MPQGRFLGVERRFTQCDLVVYFFPDSGDEFNDKENIFHVEGSLSKVLDAKQVRFVRKSSAIDMIDKESDAIAVRYSGKSMRTPTQIDEERATLEGAIEEPLDAEWGMVPV